MLQRKTLETKVKPGLVKLMIKGVKKLEYTSDNVLSTC